MRRQSGIALATIALVLVATASASAHTALYPVEPEIARAVAPLPVEEYTATVPRRELKSNRDHLHVCRAGGVTTFPP